MDFASTPGSGRGQALARSADTFARTLGGVEVQLRLLVPGGGAEDVSLSPVTVRTLTPQADARQLLELLVAASAVQAVADARGLAPARALLDNAVGIVLDGTLWAIAAIAEENYAGAAYLYRVRMVEVPANVREGHTPATRRARLFVAPVNRNTGTPAIFDPARDAALLPGAPTAPWISVGAVEHVKRTPATKFELLRAGVRGVPAGQYRAQAEARLEFDFLEWGKLQMAIAGGTQHMNVLAPQPGAARVISGARAIAAVAVLESSTASRIVLGEAAANFSSGDLIAVDSDYTGQTGYIGSGVAAAYVRDELGDPDYIRRVTFNVARVAEVSGDTLLLETPLIAGIPKGAKVQKIVAFADREGGSFFQEWSALLVIEDGTGSRVCFYYPRLQPGAPAQETAVPIAAPLEALALHASMVALPFADANDGEPVLCCRSYFPR